MSNVKTYKDIDRSILKSIPNPTKEAYEIKIKIPEFTFLGVGEQLTDRLLTFDAKTMNFRTIKLKKRASCEICGDHPTIDHLIDYE